MIQKLLLGAFLFFAILTVAAQVTTSNMSGTVVDDQSEPLLGANVVAVHTPTGTKYGAITNEDGLFQMLNMRVGGPIRSLLLTLALKNSWSRTFF